MKGDDQNHTQGCRQNAIIAGLSYLNVGKHIGGFESGKISPFANTTVDGLWYLAILTYQAMVEIHEAEGKMIPLRPNNA